MRESIGGTMLFWIVLFFMSIFITFMASVIKYAKVYKIKNSMISYIERKEGIFSKDELEDELIGLKYPMDSGYVFCKYPTEKGGYYFLKLYASFDLPIVSFHFRIPIKGETSQITTGTIIKSNNGSLFVGDGYDCIGSGVSDNEISAGRLW